MSNNPYKRIEKLEGFNKLDNTLLRVYCLIAILVSTLINVFFYFV